MSQKSIQFGTDGWRAIIAEQFTFDNAELVTRAIAQYIVNRFGTEKPVVVGHDLRFLADKFAHRSAEILTEYGLTVQMTDTWYPTPVVAYVAKYHDTAGAMMFTASHNPPEYLGIKFIPEYAGPALPDITDVLVENVRELELGPKETNNAWARFVKQGVTPQAIQSIAPRKEYEDFLANHIDFEKIRAAKPLKIMFDAMYGCAQGYVDGFLRELGHDVTSLHCEQRADFGGTMPEPIAQYLPEMVSRVAAEGYSYGLASDGDGDRFGVVDDKGNFVGANQMLPMVLRHLYKNKGIRGNVVRSLATSKLIDRLAEQYGDVDVIETPVGFKWMGKAMREQNIIVGGEESGGFSIQGHIPEKDGVLAALVITEMLVYENKPLSQIWADTVAEAGMEFHNFAKNFHISDAQKKSTVELLKSKKAGDSFAGLTIDNIDTRDGVKFNFSKYVWLTVRPSGTEPVLRVYLEATDAATCQQLQTAVLELIEKQPATCSV